MIGLIFLAIVRYINYVACQDGSLLVKGSIVIGGLVPIHDHDSTDLSQCGDLNERVGIQRLEAMLFAVDKINKNTSTSCEGDSLTKMH